MVNDKFEDQNKVSIEFRLYVNDVLLTLDKEKCMRCELCKKVCPKDAIVISGSGDNVKIDIDKDKCVLCGVCVPFCPVDALNLKVDRQDKNILLDNEGLPTFPERIKIDASRCPKECVECEKACPTEAIKVKAWKNIDVSGDKCLRCLRCVDVCPVDGAITVNPILFGDLVVKDESKLPNDLNLCVDVCPTKAMEIDKGNTLKITRRYCILCGACSNAFPEVFEAKRSRVVHGKGFSSAWNYALKNLASVNAVSQDHEERSTERAAELVKQAGIFANIYSKDTKGKIPVLGEIKPAGRGENQEEPAPTAVGIPSADGRTEEGGVPPSAVRCSCGSKG